MNNRTTTIALSDSEKEQLDDAARTLFETTEVPYGLVVATLAVDACEDADPALALA